MDRWDEIFSLLERPDKWYLGGGRALLWAPEFPAHLDAPGFWDPATWYHLHVGPLFAITILAENGHAIVPRLIARRWRVSHLLSTYELGDSMTLAERRSLSPEDTLVSELEIKSNTSVQRQLDVVVWTAQPTRADAPDADFVTALRPRRDAIVIARQVNDAKGKPVFTYCQALGAIRDADTTAVNLSQPGPERGSGAPMPPRWELTPFYEKFTDKGLPREAVTKGGPHDTLSDLTAFVAMHYRLLVPAGTVRKFSAGVSIARIGTEAARNLKRSLSVHSPADRATRTWKTFFEKVPYLRTSDPYIERAYWYRWYGLRLNMVLPAEYGPAHPCVFEGPSAGWFRHPISYSAFAHMRELRWLHDKAPAQGSLLNFVDAQHKGGDFPSAIGAEFGSEGAKGMYHADWGRSVRDLYASHGDKTFLRNIYEPLAKYARSFTRNRDRDKTGLFDVVNQFETGQEYSPRYLAVEADADKSKEFRLKGVDATVYMHEIFRTLAWMAEVIEKKRDVLKWTKLADATRVAVRERMWDAQAAMFVDVDPVSGKRSPAKAAVGFYPFLTEIAGHEHLDAIRRNLLNPKTFWTEFPVPSVSMDDPRYSADGEWKDVRMRCPWNGRSWLMTSSHVAEALAEASIRLDGSLRIRAAEMIHNLVRMTFVDHDPARPTSFEYYNSKTGQAPFFRGVDDYMHSYLVDLILKYVVGLRPQPDGSLTIDPLPFGLRKLSISNVKVRGKEISLDMIGGRGRLTVGRHSTRFQIGRPVKADLTRKRKR